MIASMGEAFVSSARRQFRALFDAFGFVEVDSRTDLNGAKVVAKNRTHYLTVSVDLRDRWVSAGFGRLAEGLVPPPPIAPPTAPSDVREIPSSIVAWLATGDRDQAFALGSYEEDTPDRLEDAVRRTADALMAHGSGLLAGDERDWARAAELTVSRRWSA